MPAVSDKSPIAHRYRLLAPHFNDHELRMWAAVEAASYGKGGIAALAQITGIAPSAIRRAQHELRIKGRLPLSPPTQSTN